MSARERLLDVSELEPCEPLERTLAACSELTAGEYLRVLHRREPYPLYGLLDKQGLAHHTRSGADTSCEILIWHSDDVVAREAVQELIAGG